MTPTTPTVHQAWADCMEDLRVIREQEENKHQKFNFRGVKTVVNACGPVFRDHKVIVMPGRIVDAKHRDFPGANNKTSHEAILTVRYDIYGPAGDMMSGEVIGEAADYGDKATQQAMSVCWRVFLCQSLSIPTDEDEPEPDSVNMERSAAPPAPKPEYDDDQRRVAYEELNKILVAKGNPAGVIDWLMVNGITNLSLTRAQAAEWYAKMEGLPDAPAPTAEPKALPKAQRDKEWAALMDGHSKLDEMTREFIKKALDAEFPGVSISKDTLTRAQAVHWHALITEALEAPM